jgi:GNAT superfamily N-acetyltransferase
LNDANTVTRERLVYLEENDVRLVRDAYTRVFRPAFDTTELPDISGVSPESGRTVLVALDETGVIAGGVSDTFPTCDIALLSYLAVRPDHRSRGTGARILDELRVRWRDTGHSLVVGEVRDPRVWETTESERPADRLRFYARNGCLLVPVPWVQPAIGDGAREHGLLLIEVSGTALGGKIEATALAAWAATYYRDSESGEPDDEQYRALLSRVSARDLELIPVEDYERVEPLGSEAGSESPDS